MALAAAMIAMGLNGCGNRGLEGTYETSAGGLFEPERIVIQGNEATIGAGAASKTYTFEKEGEVLVLTRKGETRRVKLENGNLVEDSQVFERK